MAVYPFFLPIDILSKGVINEPIQEVIPDAVACQYHIVWTLKYQYKILVGDIAMEINNGIRGFSEQLGCEVTELNIQNDHVHLLAMVPPKISI
jgi:hypothetical protein